MFTAIPDRDKILSKIITFMEKLRIEKSMHAANPKVT